MHHHSSVWLNLKLKSFLFYESTFLPLKQFKEIERKKDARLSWPMALEDFNPKVCSFFFFHLLSCT